MVSSESPQCVREESFDVENPYTPLVSSIKGKLDLLPTLSGECCIYRVPKKIREQKDAAFTPQVVSIGPLHHGKGDLKVMEEHKQRYLKKFLARPNVSMEDYIAIVKENEVKLRDCYAETIQIGSDEFVEMILVDAVFIIELLLKDREYESHSDVEDDRIFTKPWMLHDVMVDMLVLENQIPYFILEKIYDAARIKSSSSKEEEGRLSIISLFYHCFKQFFTQEDILDKYRSSKFVHFLDFFRIAYQPTDVPVQRNTESRNKLTVTALERAGVKFQARDSSKNNMFDIKFEDGILQIPKIVIQGGTEVLLRNLIAFEECNCDTSVLVDYATFLDSLIDTEKDIEILGRNEVLEAWSSDNMRALNIFNGLSASCTFAPDNFFYAGVWKDLDDYYKVPWHKWKAILRQSYFNTPWATISVMAAVVLLILTALQSVWSITHP
ncbi:putative UPF0481 protein At3g02645 isoform X2 [Tripterygium wilfordii]|uniref:putative UPF0481 protein At3g02645 isoform X2 n=1 Tax=Tripterygium wilfordii TaxID=458696 RepID=UPI0018F85BAB|nr:putative UPF0481 protein At3g02645 isoform X2 [Tripterygium wilfordii]